MGSSPGAGMGSGAEAPEGAGRQPAEGTLLVVNAGFVVVMDDRQIAHDEQDQEADQRTDPPIPGPGRGSMAIPRHLWPWHHVAHCGQSPKRRTSCSVTLNRRVRRT